jgi:hypothetical protein
VVATGLPPEAVAAELGHLRDVARLAVVRVAGAPDLATLLNEGLRACRSNLVGFAIPPERLEGQHLDKVVAGLLAAGADAAHGDRLLLDGRGVMAPDLVPGIPATSAFSLSTLVMRIETAHDTGAFDGSDVGIARWLGRLAERFQVVHVPVVTVEAPSAPHGGAPVEEALAQMRLRPLDLYRELVALHARNEALLERLRRLEGGDRDASRR